MEPTASTKINALRFMIYLLSELRRWALDSAKGSEAAPKGTRLDDVREDLALPVVQRFVNFGERIERALASPVDDHVMAIEHGLDTGAIERLSADELCHVR